MTATSGIEISASLEDYLEAIFQIINDKQAARAKDIGKRLNVGRSSVTGALHALADRELINYAPYDVITLTDKGKAIAEDVVRRHEVLRDFFVKVLGVAQIEADEAACKMEHAISDTILERFVEFVELVERCPRGGSKWIKGLGHHCQSAKAAQHCEKCVELVLDEVRRKNMEQTTETQAPTSLAKLKPGDKATVIKIEGGGAIRRRLLDMGAVKGTLLEIERVAPLGDPIAVKIRGYHLTLRKEEAERIKVREV